MEGSLINGREHDYFREMLPARALDCLDPDEAEILARHLTRCPSCLDDLTTFETVVGQLALAVPDVAPSPELRRRLLALAGARPSSARAKAGAGRSRQPRRLDFRRGWPVYAVVALAAVILGGLLWAAAGRLLLGGERLVELNPTELAPEARGELRLSGDGRAATLEVFRLPALDDEQTYQLWLVSEDERDSGALFTVNENGWAEVPVELARRAADYRGFGVTIEPTGGSPGPTGAQVLGSAQ